MQHTAIEIMRTFNFTLLAAVLSYVTVIGAAPPGAGAHTNATTNVRELYVV